MLIPALTSLYNGVMPLLLDVLGDLWDLLEIIWKTIEKNILPYVRAAIDILVAFVTLLVQLVGPVVIGVVDQIIDTFKFLVKTILNVLGLVVDFLTGDFSGAMDHLKGILTDSIDFLGDTVNNIFNTVYTIATTIGNAIRDFFANIYNSIRSNFLNPLIDVANALDRKFNGGKNQMDYFGKMMTTSEEAQYNKEQMQATWSDAYGGGVAAGAAAAATVFTNAYSGVGATIKSEYGNAYSKPGGGLIYAGGRAIGGPVSSGLPYMVGERGPELFVPNSNGYIAPNVASGRPITVVLEVDGRQVAKATAPYTSDYVRMRQGVRKGVR
jgi:phage-related protein